MAKEKSLLKDAFYFAKYEDIAELQFVTKNDIARRIQGLAMTREFNMAAEDLAYIGAVNAPGHSKDGDTYVYIHESKWKTIPADGAETSVLFKGIIEEDELTRTRREKEALEAEIAELRKLKKQDGKATKAKEEPNTGTDTQI